MTRAILVTGPRSLAHYPDAPRAKVWCRTHVLSTLTALDADTIIVGDAPGVDTWMRALASEARTVVVYEAQSGRVMVYCGVHKVRSVRRWMEPEALALHEPSRRPLLRNHAMIDENVKTIARGVAFIDPRSTTHGTQHTVRHARASGLTVDVHRWEVK